MSSSHPLDPPSLRGRSQSTSASLSLPLRLLFSKLSISLLHVHCLCVSKDRQTDRRTDVSHRQDLIWSGRSVASRPNGAEVFLCASRKLFAAQSERIIGANSSVRPTLLKSGWLRNFPRLVFAPRAIGWLVGWPLSWLLRLLSWPSIRPSVGALAARVLRWPHFALVLPTKTNSIRAGEEGSGEGREGRQSNFSSM